MLQNFEEVKKKSKFYDKILGNIKESGFVTPTPIQRQIVPLLLHRREVLAVAPTGDPGNPADSLLCTDPTARCIVCRRLEALSTVNPEALCDVRRPWKALLLPMAQTI